MAAAAFLPESWLCQYLCPQHLVNSINFGVACVMIAQEKTQTPVTMIALQPAIAQREKLVGKLT